jgi:chemotaxis response regulator CheB
MQAKTDNGGRHQSLLRHPGWDSEVIPSCLKAHPRQGTEFDRNGCEPQQCERTDTPMVCIGMSAGGLKPLQTIVKQLSPSTGMAFFVVCHLSRTEPTSLPWLLSLWSGMPAELALHGELLSPIAFM